MLPDESVQVVLKLELEMVELIVELKVEAENVELELPDDVDGIVGDTGVDESEEDVATLEVL
jgi:hypothetical protein